MATRGSFQKRQKEAARREKRQMKLDRRQGRQPARGSSPSVTPESEHPANPGATDDNSSTDSDKSDSSFNA